MPQTILHVSSATIVSGDKWLDEAFVAGPADENYATYSASSAETASLALTFDTAEIPANAVIGNIAVRLWGSWAGSGEPIAVKLNVGDSPPLEFIVTETPGMSEVSDPAGWGMSSAALNALTGQLTVESSGVEVFAFDAIEVAVDWEEAPPPSRSMSIVRRARILGII